MPIRYGNWQADDAASRAGGAVILSGLLTHQAPAVIAAYRARGLVPLRHLRIEGWSSLLLRKMRVNVGSDGTARCASC